MLVGIVSEDDLLAKKGPDPWRHLEARVVGWGDGNRGKPMIGDTPWMAQWPRRRVPYHAWHQAGQRSDVTRRVRDRRLRLDDRGRVECHGQGHRLRDHRRPRS